MDNELEIIVEEYAVFDGEECSARANYIIVNGERIRTTGSVLKSVLEHLGYDPYITFQ